ncbi:MAG: ABC transporter ATP-binding protein [Anaerolineae bacterium]
MTTIEPTVQAQIVPKSTAVPIIEAEHLSIEYRLGSRWLNALYDVNLTIYPNEIHGLVGESGSGKSTLALALMRYMATNARVSSGTIRFDGDDITHLSPVEMRAKWGSQIALVPQDALASLNPSYTIGEQIAELARLHLGETGKTARDHAVEMLRRVKIADPDTVARRYPHQISGGMQQRVTIAMALITKPRLLVLDEPTTALDVTTQAVIVDLFRDLIRENNAAALYVSHDLGLIAQLCDRVTVLYSGEVMASAPVIDLFKHPIHPYTISLLASLPRPVSGSETRLHTIEGVAPSLAERPEACVFSTRCHACIQLCRDVKPPLETLSNGREVRCHRWREIEAGTLVIDTQAKAGEASAPPDAAHVLEARQLDKTFDAGSMFNRLTGHSGVHAVDHVSLHVNQRSTLGLVGESGSGKTTVARIIVGLEPTDSGNLELLDLPLSPDVSRRSRKALRQIQMIFQNPNDAMNPYMSVGDTLKRTIVRLSTERPTDEQINERIAELLEAVRLPADYAARYPSELSGGEKQRVAMARAFATNPALVVADEPTSALDVSVQSVILNLLKDLRTREGAAYLFISHDLKAVAYLADWIAVMYLGEIVEEGTAEQVTAAPSHPYTEALVSAIPTPDPTVQGKRIRLEGDPPSPRDIPQGCRFHTRCPRKLGAICETEAPPFRDAGDGHFIRCHIPVDELVSLQRESTNVFTEGRT